jgi:hypothetical protein
VGVCGIRREQRGTKREETWLWQGCCKTKPGERLQAQPRQAQPRPQSAYEAGGEREGVGDERLLRSRIQCIIVIEYGIVRRRSDAASALSETSRKECDAS